ncbi:hypothetical protein CEUSTIGMA_g1977.t1 [Chlamydomonas eustigma]|uniref:Uncharacterized protein n=1 Tax=Chlamydomonas eustigma TaxID=1157962 RepID=A0A250WUN5_9CHLO|nr:hypothetical protein CEUSTIGMA_g1977.t1 [Chlamydomonas eustigma]|eukprot:GAX74528.1 hypothetical protein CEUSTIGMA_g1977.t1 [Chlamydomonas eustigma]
MSTHYNYGLKKNDDDKALMEQDSIEYGWLGDDKRMPIAPASSPGPSLLPISSSSFAAESPCTPQQLIEIMDTSAPSSVSPISPPLTYWAASPVICVASNYDYDKDDRQSQVLPQASSSSRRQSLLNIAEQSTPVMNNQQFVTSLIQQQQHLSLQAAQVIAQSSSTDNRPLKTFNQVMKSGEGAKQLLDFPADEESSFHTDIHALQTILSPREPFTHVGSYVGSYHEPVSGGFSSSTEPQQQASSRSTKDSLHQSHHTYFPKQHGSRNFSSAADLQLQTSYRVQPAQPSTTPGGVQGGGAAMGMTSALAQAAAERGLDGTALALLLQNPVVVQMLSASPAASGSSPMTDGIASPSRLVNHGQYAEESSSETQVQQQCRCVLEPLSLYQVQQQQQQYRQSEEHLKQYRVQQQQQQNREALEPSQQYQVQQQYRLSEEYQVQQQQQQFKGGMEVPAQTQAQMHLNLTSQPPQSSGLGLHFASMGIVQCSTRKDASSGLLPTLSTTPPVLPSSLTSTPSQTSTRSDTLAVIPPSRTDQHTDSELTNACTVLVQLMLSAYAFLHSEGIQGFFTKLGPIAHLYASMHDLPVAQKRYRNQEMSMLREQLKEDGSFMQILQAVIALRHHLYSLSRKDQVFDSVPIDLLLGSMSNELFHLLKASLPAEVLDYFGSGLPHPRLAVLVFMEFTTVDAVALLP